MISGTGSVTRNAITRSGCSTAATAYLHVLRLAVARPVSPMVSVMSSVSTQNAILTEMIVATVPLAVLSRCYRTTHVTHHATQRSVDMIWGAVGSQPVKKMAVL
jgi:hypothetical protein